jgi:hypothetical protein
MWRGSLGTPIEAPYVGMKPRASDSALWYLTVHRLPIPAAVVVKSHAFLGITLCKLLDDYRNVGGTSCLYPQV